LDTAAGAIRSWAESWGGWRARN